MAGWLRLVRASLCAAAAAAGVARAEGAAPKPSDLVTLTAQQPGAGTCPLGGAPFQQISGSSQLSPFAVPPKRVLVITAVQLVVDDANPGTNALITAQSASEEQLLTVSALTLDAGGDGGASIVLPSGLLVPSGRTVCLRSGAPIAGGYVHGYLAREK